MKIADAVRRYRKTPKGRVAHQRQNARRLWFGNSYLGYAGDDIHAQAKERTQELIRGFRDRQSTEGD